MKRGNTMSDNLVCSEKHIHEYTSKINQDLIEFKNFNKMSELFKIFGDQTRLKILFVLFEKEVCVCDIADIVGMQQSAVSHQLRVLKQANLVKYRRDGKTIYYSLSDNHVKTIFAQAKEHIEE